MRNTVTVYNMPNSGKALSFQEPQIMGIVNLTEDSFYDKSRIELGKLTDVVGTMREEGADIIDIGGMSSRPGAIEIPVNQEIDRLLPALELINHNFSDSIISVDTYRSEVVERAADVGFDIVNDISAGHKDERILSVSARRGLVYIMMHMKGTPQNMQDDIQYDNLIVDMLGYFTERIAKAKSVGLNDIIVDPGIGFGKTIQHNYKIIKSLSSFSIFDYPVMMGLSRKSFIYKTLDTNASAALNGTTAMHMISLLNGADILRVHDIKEAVQCKLLYQEYWAS